MSSSSSSFSSFLYSDNIFSKFAFIITLLLVFIILLKLGTYILVYFYGQNMNPYLINGMVNGKNMRVFTQDPGNKGSVNIPRSSNEQGGIEFTWSCWVYIDDLTYNSSQYRCIFYKGSDPKEISGDKFQNNAPGLYIAPGTNKIVVNMSTFDTINEQIEIDNFPLNKWVNIIIRCRNRTLDVYINGTIDKSVQLSGVPKQNYGYVYVGANGGFSGYLSNLRYFSKAIGTYDIQKILMSGPNTKMLDASGTPNAKDPNYLSLGWYFDSASPDMYNP